MRVWCDRHDAAHRFTAGEAERIIYALSGEVASALCEPDGDRVFAGEDAWQNIPCPLEYLNLSRSLEGYAELTEAFVRARRNEVSR